MSLPIVDCIDPLTTANQHSSLVRPETSTTGDSLSLATANPTGDSLSLAAPPSRTGF